MENFKERQNFKVTLLRTPIVFHASALNFSTVTPPLALAYLSACLRKNGFSVSNIDAVGEKIDQFGKVAPDSGLEYQGLSVDEILQRIDPETDVLGVSCMFSSEWTHTRRIIKAIKKRFPKITLIAGGEHATAIPFLVMTECPEIDLVVLGEAEEAIVEVVDCLRRNGDLEKVNRIIFRKNGSTIQTAPRARIRKIDEIPWPAWDLLPLENYLNSRSARGTLNIRTIPMLASRGCPYECTFCSNPNMYGRYYVTRNHEDLLNEIAHYIDKYQIEDVDFFDLTTITKRKWILQFCDSIIQKKLKFVWRITGGTRTEAIDEEVIIKAKQAGCEYLGFAPESGSEEILKEVKKQVNIKRMYELFKLAVKHGISTKSNFIIGFPRETRKQIYATLFLQMKLAFVGVSDSPIFEFMPYPGCEETDYLIKNNHLKMDDEYFDSLTTNISLTKKKRYCENVGPLELYFYRISGLSLYYFVYYLIRPFRFFKFMKNFWGNQVFNSIFEQRIMENLNKFKKRAARSF